MKTSDHRDSSLAIMLKRCFAICCASVLAFVSLASSAHADTPVRECQKNNGIYLYLSFRNSIFAEGCTYGPNAGARIDEISSHAESGGSGWICQIGGMPESCEAPTPNTWTYWTFWWAQGGDSWIYATMGRDYPGMPGTVELWNYGDGWDEPPTIAPPPLYTPDNLDSQGGSGGRTQPGGTGQQGGSSTDDYQAGEDQATDRQDSENNPSASGDSSTESSSADPSASTLAKKKSTSSPSARSASSHPSSSSSVNATGAKASVPSSHGAMTLVVVGIVAIAALGYGIYYARRKGKA